MATQQEIIKRFMKALDTHKFNWSDKDFYKKILDEAIDYATSGSSRHFSTIAEAITAMKADIRSTNNADTFLKNFCGINLDNTDTGAITGSDAGSSTTKTAKSVVPETKTASNFTGTSFPVNGLTVKLGKAYKNLSPYEKYIWNNLHEHWMKGGLDLIVQSYGDNFSFNKNSTVKNITVTFFKKIGGVVAETQPVFNTGNSADDYMRKSATELTLAINLAYYKTDSIISSDSDGKPNAVMYSLGGADSKEAYLDRTIAHEMTHAVMYANINYLALLPRYILEGMAELTSGADDLRKSDLKVLAANSSKLESALNGASSIEGVSNPAYSGGYMFLRWLAKQASGVGITDYADSINNTVSSATINALGGNDTISNTGSQVKIYGSLGNDSIKNDAWNVTVDGGAGNDSITGYYDNYLSIAGGTEHDLVSLNSVWYSTIDGGTGNDTILSSYGRYDSINGGAGNDVISLQSSASVYASTLIGGLGNDTIYSDSNPNLFKYANGDGNDIIYGFNATSTLQFSNSTNISLQTSGKNIVATVGKGKVTLVGAKSLSAINIQGSGSSDYIKSTVSGAKIDALGGNDTISNTGSNSSLSGGAGNDKIYNYASSKVTILGGSGADTITNWGAGASMDGGTGNDLIWGDSGNDTLSGGANNDKLHGEEGNDKIYGGTGNDTLWGGGGNDSLWGNAGTDTFIYEQGEGKDVIFGFENTDLLQITGTFSTSYSKSKKEVYFNVGSTKNAITLKDFGSTSTFNVNGTNYKINELVKK